MLLSGWHERIDGTVFAAEEEQPEVQSAIGTGPKDLIHIHRSSLCATPKATRDIPTSLGMTARLLRTPHCFVSIG